MIKEGQKVGLPINLGLHSKTIFGRPESESHVTFCPTHPFPSLIPITSCQIDQLLEIGKCQPRTHSYGISDTKSLRVIILELKEAKPLIQAMVISYCSCISFLLMMQDCRNQVVNIRWNR